MKVSTAEVLHVLVDECETLRCVYADQFLAQWTERIYRCDRKSLPDYKRTLLA